MTDTTNQPARQTRYAMLMRPADDGGYEGVLLREATLADIEAGTCAPFASRDEENQSWATLYAIAGPMARLPGNPDGRTPEKHMTKGYVVTGEDGKPSYRPDSFTAACLHDYTHLDRLVDEGVGGPADHPAMRVTHVLGTIIPAKGDGSRTKFRTVIDGLTHHRSIIADALRADCANERLTCIAVRVMSGMADPNNAVVVAMGSSDPVRVTREGNEAYLTAIAGPRRSAMPPAPAPTTSRDDDAEPTEDEVRTFAALATPVEDAFPQPGCYPSETYQDSLRQLTKFMTTIAECPPYVEVTLGVIPGKATLTTSMRLPTGVQLARTKVVDQGRETWGKNLGTLALMRDLADVDGCFMHLTAASDGDGGYYLRRSLLHAGHETVMAEYYDSRSAQDGEPEVGLKLRVATSADDATNIGWLTGREDQG